MSTSPRAQTFVDNDFSKWFESVSKFYSLFKKSVYIITKTYLLSDCYVFLPTII